MSKQKVAFIGLGVMGYPMAGHLAKAGYETRVYNRTAAKAEKWCKEYGGSHGLTPREAAEGADFVFMCVGNDDELRTGPKPQAGAHLLVQMAEDLALLIRGYRIP